MNLDFLQNQQLTSRPQGGATTLVQEVTKVQLPSLQDAYFTPADFVQIAGITSIHAVFRPVIS